MRDNFSPQACTRVLEHLDLAQQSFLVQIGDEHISLRKSELYLGFLLFAREVLNRFMMVKLLQTELEVETAKTAQENAEKKASFNEALVEGAVLQNTASDKQTA